MKIKKISILSVTEHSIHSAYMTIQCVANIVFDCGSYQLLSDSNVYKYSAQTLDDGML